MPDDAAVYNRGLMVRLTPQCYEALEQEAAKRGMSIPKLASEALDAWTAESRCRGHVQACPICHVMTSQMVISQSGHARCLSCTGRENAAKRGR